ncbi:unnamed protein product [Amoebophrya sp. A120]|nr:unnamed protein product [Amoebophrya sp. A120]|eukprot:GSA120T00019310001.1
MSIRKIDTLLALFHENDGNLQSHNHRGPRTISFTPRERESLWNNLKNHVDQEFQTWLLLQKTNFHRQGSTGSSTAGTSASASSSGISGGSGLFAAGGAAACSSTGATVADGAAAATSYLGTDTSPQQEEPEAPRDENSTVAGSCLEDVSAVGAAKTESDSKISNDDLVGEDGTTGAKIMTSSGSSSSSIINHDFAAASPVSDSASTATPGSSCSTLRCNKSSTSSLFALDENSTCSPMSAAAALRGLSLDQSPGRGGVAGVAAGVAASHDHDVLPPATESEAPFGIGLVPQEFLRTAAEQGQAASSRSTQTLDVADAESETLLAAPSGAAAALEHDEINHDFSTAHELQDRAAVLFPLVDEEMTASEAVPLAASPTGGAPNAAPPLFPSTTATDEVEEPINTPSSTQQPIPTSAPRARISRLSNRIQRLRRRNHEAERYVGFDPDHDRITLDYLRTLANADGMEVPPSVVPRFLRGGVNRAANNRGSAGAAAAGPGRRRQSWRGRRTTDASASSSASPNSAGNGASASSTTTNNVSNAPNTMTMNAGGTSTVSTTKQPSTSTVAAFVQHRAIMDLVSTIGEEAAVALLFYLLVKNSGDLRLHDCSATSGRTSSRGSGRTSSGAAGAGGSSLPSVSAGAAPAMQEMRFWTTDVPRSIVQPHGEEQNYPDSTRRVELAGDVEMAAGRSIGGAASSTGRLGPPTESVLVRENCDHLDHRSCSPADFSNVEVQQPRLHDLQEEQEGESEQLLQDEGQLLPRIAKPTTPAATTSESRGTTEIGETPSASPVGEQEEGDVEMGDVGAGVRMNYNDARRAQRDGDHEYDYVLRTSGADDATGFEEIALLGDDEHEALANMELLHDNDAVLHRLPSFTPPSERPEDRGAVLDTHILTSPSDEMNSASEADQQDSSDVAEMEDDRTGLDEIVSAGQNDAHISDGEEDDLLAQSNSLLSRSSTSLLSLSPSRSRGTTRARSNTSSALSSNLNFPRTSSSDSFPFGIRRQVSNPANSSSLERSFDVSGVSGGSLTPGGGQRRAASSSVTSNIAAIPIPDDEDENDLTSCEETSSEVGGLGIPGSAVSAGGERGREAEREQKQNSPQSISGKAAGDLSCSQEELLLLPQHTCLRLIPEDGSFSDHFAGGRSGSSSGSLLRSGSVAQQQQHETRTTTTSADLKEEERPTHDHKTQPPAVDLEERAKDHMLQRLVSDIFFEADENCSNLFHDDVVEFLLQTTEDRSSSSTGNVNNDRGEQEQQRDDPSENANNNSMMSETDSDSDSAEMTSEDGGPDYSDTGSSSSKDPTATAPHGTRASCSFPRPTDKAEQIRTQVVDYLNSQKIVGRLQPRRRGSNRPTSSNGRRNSNTRRRSTTTSSNSEDDNVSNTSSNNREGPINDDEGHHSCGTVCCAAVIAFSDLGCIYHSIAATLAQPNLLPLMAIFPVSGCLASRVMFAQFAGHNLFERLFERAERNRTRNQARNNSNNQGYYLRSTRLLRDCCDRFFDYHDCCCTAIARPYVVVTEACFQGILECVEDCGCCSEACEDFRPFGCVRDTVAQCAGSVCCCFGFSGAVAGSASTTTGGRDRTGSGMSGTSARDLAVSGRTSASDSAGQRGLLLHNEGRERELISTDRDSGSQHLQIELSNTNYGSTTITTGSGTTSSASRVSPSTKKTEPKPPSRSPPAHFLEPIPQNVSELKDLRLSDCAAAFIAHTRQSQRQCELKRMRGRIKALLTDQMVDRMKYGSKREKAIRLNQLAAFASELQAVVLAVEEQQIAGTHG